MQSRFNEADSMGANLLRFLYYLLNKELPIAAIISGEKNSTTFAFAEREKFHISYSKFANKLIASKQLCETYGIEPSKICFVFDDVLYLNLAEVVGFRVFIPRKANPLLNEYVIKHQLADYTTGCTSGQGSVREACELMIGLNGNYNEVITERKNFTQTYADYLELRKAVIPNYFTVIDVVLWSLKYN